MDVGMWLRNLGLGQYEDKFRESKVDVDVLADLTDGDLEKLGLPLGDRKRLLRAIATLASRELLVTAARDAAAASVPPLTSWARADSVERRPITVMFCDLVGSTSLAAKLDAEDWRNLVNAYLDAAAAAVTGLGGHVLKRLGDGLMALFGYPTAQENDAERAVRAALAIQRALSELNARDAGRLPELAARIGLESGPVVVEARGEVFGDAPNIAARVQRLADPGSVLVTMNVHRQVAGLFVVEERGERELRGVAEPIQLFHIVRASGAGPRGGARALTPFVGREEELGILARRWERVRAAGDGQLVLVAGEPGLGKSRLLVEFHSRLAETPHTWAEFSSSQLLQNTPLHPVAEWGRHRFGADTPPEQRLADLEGTLRLIGLDPAEYAPLVAPLVDIPFPPGRAINLPPEELRRRQLAALIAWFLAGARSQPAVLAFEDLHWADPSSLDLMRALAERGQQAPLLIIATARPEFRPPWSLRSHHSLVSLAPLDRGEVTRMVREISARHGLSKDVVDGVSERTGGVPLFVEEVTRLLLERGDQGGAQAIPPTLQQSLIARLDRLGEAREVAQIGAVIGHSFSYALLSAVAGMEDGPLRGALDKLAEADILLAQGLPPESTYRFKHALIQDAAYEYLLKSRRQILHRRAAEILRDRFPATAAAEPEVLAHHFTQADFDDEAIEWWGNAGDQALKRSAFPEAIAHLRKAIAIADKTMGSTLRNTAASASNRLRRLKLQTNYGLATMWSKGYGAEETKAAFADALKLAAGTADFAERFAAYFGVWIGGLSRGDLALARRVAETFQREAEDEAHAPSLARACSWLGVTLMTQGDLAGGRAQLECALKIYDPRWDREARLAFGTDVGVMATDYLAMTSWLLGNVAQARELIELAVSRAIQSEDVPTRAATYVYCGQLEVFRGDAKALLPVAESLVALSQEYGLARHWLAYGKKIRGWASARLGDREAGIKELREGMAALADQGFTRFVPFFRALLAEIESEMGESALSRIDSALALASETGEHWSDSFLHRVRGEILLNADPTDAAPAEEAFRAAIAVAEQQGARSFELQAALALAKLYRSTGRPADAHAVLAPALEGFSPTPELPEIVGAQALLADLS